MNTATTTDIYLNKRWIKGDDAQLMRDLEQPATSSAGVVVNHGTALRHSAVWAAVTRISGDIAKLPLNMFERQADDARELASAHPTHRAVRWRANTHNSAFRFWRTMMMHVLLWNRAYAFIQRNSLGQCYGLVNLAPDRVTPLRDENSGEYELFRVTSNDGRTTGLVFAEDILDITGIQYDHSNIIDTTFAARDNWATGMAANDFLNAFFANGSMAGGILMVPSETTPQSRKNALQGLKEKIGGLSNAFRILPLYDGMKFEQTTIRPIDAEIAKLLEHNVKDVARWFNIPPSKIGADSSGVYGSREQDARDYLDSCLSPWLTNIAAQCWLKLLTLDAQRRDRYYFEHRVDALIETEVLTKYQVMEIGIRSGLLSPDEGRRMLNMNPRDDGFGDIYYHSNNMQPMTEETLAPPETPPVAVDEEEPPEQPPEVTVAMERLYGLEREKIVARFKRRLSSRVKRHGTAGAASWWQVNRTKQRAYLAKELANIAKPLAVVTGQPPESIGLTEADAIISQIEQGEF